MKAIRHWLSHTTGGLPRTFWHLWVVTLINKLGSFVIIYLTLYLAVVREFTPGTIGLLLGAQGAGAIAGTQLAGMLSDRWGRRKTLLLSNFSAAVVLIALAFTETVWAIGVMLLFLGAALNMARPAFSAMIADLVPITDRVRAYTLNYWAINLGFSGAALLAGLVAGFNFQLIFFINAGALTLTGLLVAFRVPETRPVAAAPPTDGGPVAPVKAFRVIRRDRIFLAFVGLTFLPAFLMMSMEALLPLQVTGAGLTEQQYSYIIATNGIIIVAGQLFIPKLVEGKRRTRVLALASLFWAVGVGATGLASTIPMFMLTVLVWTIGEMLQTPANSATIADLAPVTMRGRYQATFSLAYQGAGLLAPAIGGLGLQYLGSWWWAVAAGIGGLAAIGNLLAEPSRERRLAAIYAADKTVHSPALDDRAETPPTEHGPASEPEKPESGDTATDAGTAPRKRGVDDTGELTAVSG